MERVLVLEARRLDFTGSDGRRVEGVKVTYITQDRDVAPDRKGYPPLTINAPSELWFSFGELPSFYNCEFRQRPGANGKPTLQMVNASKMEVVNLEF